jgi:hypothetical protein
MLAGKPAGTVRVGTIGWPGRRERTVEDIHRRDAERSKTEPGWGRMREKPRGSVAEEAENTEENLR